MRRNYQAIVYSHTSVSLGLVWHDRGRDIDIIEDALHTCLLAGRLGTEAVVRKHSPGSILLENAQ